MMKPDTIARFIQKAPKGTIEFHLVYLKQNDSEDVIQSWNQADIEFDETPPIELANSILDACQSHCDEEQIVCSYRLRAVDRDGKQLSSSRIRRNPREALPDPIGLTDQQGNSALQQLVRVCEGLMRMTIAQSNTVHEGYQRLLSDQRAEIAQLRRREARATEFAYQLISTSSDEADEATKNQLMDKFGGVLERVGERFITEHVPSNGGAPKPTDEH